MDQSVTFIGEFRVTNYDAWVPAIHRMVEFVSSHVPRVRSFAAYASADGRQGVVVYIHPDADSLDEHLAAAAELIEAGSEMVEVTSIRLLGAPNPATVDRLRASGTDVTVLPLVGGFARA